MKIRFTTLHSIVNLRYVILLLNYENFRKFKSDISRDVENSRALTQFPFIIPRIINSSVHDDLSRYRTNFPSVKSRRGALLIRRLAGSASVHRQIEHSSRNYAHYAPRVARARERRHYARKRVISVIISISAVPEISSSHSRYFRSVPCGGMRPGLAAMMARLAERAPDLIHYVSLSFLGGVYFI